MTPVNINLNSTLLSVMVMLPQMLVVASLNEAILLAQQLFHKTTRNFPAIFRTASIPEWRINQRDAKDNLNSEHEQSDSRPIKSPVVCST